ncbi:MAG: tetratricopeptide repeat protein [Qingshengfaniella sp.]
MRLSRPLTVAALVLALVTPAGASDNSGAYLAARQAAYDGNFAKAADYFSRALALDPGNQSLMESALGANVALGNFEIALPIARRLLNEEADGAVARLVVLADLAARDDFAAIGAQFDAGLTVIGGLDGLIRAWALMGEGKVERALAAFDTVATERPVHNIALYHKALALASVGDYEAADDILSGRSDGVLLVSRRNVTAHVQVLAQLDQHAAAVDLIDNSVGPNPAPVFMALRERLQSGADVPYDIAVTAREGIAETFFSVAGVLSQEQPATFALLYARVAQYLNPTHLDADLLIASLLEDMGQYDLAIQAYSRVPADSDGFVTAELGRAEALYDAGRIDEAVEVLRQLAGAEPDMLIVQMSLADTLRRLERFAEAGMAYDAAIALIAEPRPPHWMLWFSRGITRERTDRWPEAEADFRFALDLNPGQPQVLNYLGYSMVEMGETLDEALQMIQEAVAARPGNGYITDSLGWVFYRLGRYGEAVEQMEKAVALEPVDPVVNDHLGDVYWAVGRRMEARFQWHRALSFDPEADDATRIRRKLEIGLDAVLDEEGAQPLGARDG